MTPAGASAANVLDTGLHQKIVSLNMHSWTLYLTFDDSLEGPLDGHVSLVRAWQRRALCPEQTKSQSSLETVFSNVNIDVYVIQQIASLLLSASFLLLSATFSECIRPLRWTRFVTFNICEAHHR